MGAVAKKKQSAVSTDVLDDILEFMVGRKEASLNVLFFLVWPYAYNHTNYCSYSFFTDEDTWPLKLWRVRLRDRDVSKVIKLRICCSMMGMS